MLPRIMLHISSHKQTARELLWFGLWFFDFTVVLKWYTFSRNHTLHFECWSFPGLAMYDCDAGQRQWQQVSAPSHPQNREGKEPTLYSVLCFQHFFVYRVLCFHILSYLQNACLSLSLASVEKRRKAITWDETQDNCPAWRQQSIIT